MTNPVLPPDFANAPVRALFDPALPDPVKVTLFQIHALAWVNKGEHTSPMTKVELCETRGIEKRTWESHLNILLTRGHIMVEKVTGSWKYILYPQKTAQKSARVLGDTPENHAENGAVCAPVDKTAQKSARVLGDTPENHAEIGASFGRYGKTSARFCASFRPCMSCC